MRPVMPWDFPFVSSVQRNDIALAHDLIEGLEADAVIADKGHDADHVVQTIVEAGADAVIPTQEQSQNPAVLRL